MDRRWFSGAWCASAALIAMSSTGWLAVGWLAVAGMHLVGLVSALNKADRKADR